MNINLERYYSFHFNCCVLYVCIGYGIHNNCYCAAPSLCLRICPRPRSCLCNVTYELSSGIASSNESMISSEGSLVPLTVFESPTSLKPRAVPVSPVSGASQNLHSQSGSVFLVLGSSKNPHSRARSISPVFGSTQKPSSKGISMLKDWNAYI